MLRKDPPRKKDVIDLSDNAMKKRYINLDDEGPGAEHLGTLIVVLLKAKDLNDKHFRKQDVYAQTTLNGITKKTKVDVRAGQHPVWDEEVRYSIVKSKKARNRKLEVACYSQEPSPLPDVLLGKAVIDLAETLKTGEFDEWVELDVDGVQRGEMYLEMTYFSNEPEPEKPEKPSQPLAAPKNKILSNVLEIDSVSLQRRPSKLSPTDRLSRISTPLASVQTTPYPQGPPLSHTPSVQQQPLPNQSGRPRLSMTPSYGASPQGKWDPLPPPSEPEKLESSVPALLRPGGKSPQSSSPVSIPQLVSPASYFNHRRPSPSPPSPYVGPQFGTSPPIPSNLNPYIGVAPSPQPTPGPPQNPHMLAHSPSQNLSGPSAHWRQDNYTPLIDPSIQGVGGFMMPIPMQPGPHIQDPRDGMYPSSPQLGYGASPRPTHIRAGSDPTLRARYSTPLPLPPGARNPVQPVAPQAAPVLEMPSPPTLPSKPSKPSPDPTRIGAHKHAEDEANKKREQEIKDMELAMQLDRELNFS